MDQGQAVATRVELAAMDGKNGTVMPRQSRVWWWHDQEWPVAAHGDWPWGRKRGSGAGEGEGEF